MDHEDSPPSQSPSGVLLELSQILTDKARHIRRMAGTQDDKTETDSPRSSGKC